MSSQIERVIGELLAGPRHPDREFILSGATFGQVYDMAAQLAGTCSTSEYTQTAVCLAVEDRAIVAAALLASLAGGPTLLLPYSLSAGALEQIQKQTGFKAVIADGNRDVPEDVAVIQLQVEKRQSGARLSHGNGRSELLRIFTGGSTDTPQIWSKTTNNIFGEALFLAQHFGVTPNDRIVATVPPYHIYGLLFSVVLPLVASAGVSAETPSFPGEIASVIKEKRATVLAAVPAHYRALRETKLKTPDLRIAFSSAGMLEQEDGKAFFDNNGVGVTEVYGSTETGGIATRNRGQSEEYFTAFATVDWQVHDDCLAVRSPYLSAGLALDEDGFFLTADRAEIVEHNGFILKGRADTVTKVGGKRVDLEEIRTALKEIAGVSDCVVMALPEKSGREHRLAALIQAVDVQRQTIIKKLGDVLESYAIPRRLTIVAQMPVKENGKYDREAIIRLLAP